MHAVERHYRLLTIQERIAQLEGELVVILEESPQGPSQNRLEGAIWSLQQAARKLESAPVSTKKDLTQMLTLSIASRREQKRCEQIGSEVLPKNETAHAENVSRSSKPSNLQTIGE